MAATKDAAMQPHIIIVVIFVIFLSAAKVWRKPLPGKERFTLVSITIIGRMNEFSGLSGQKKE